ncbi:Dolichyl-diphosphooligosaccharide--protein glycosyltransferase subunit 2 [Morus notabilis]|uniref:Dolichyl-diphosphooligosaccharide--protein glycosyltransferase subunit 2 n=1 Tax=Morus notabilis TaxID=981085 RepID=W9RFI4_9ROSA|nr:Dolichyl-diphosphooligosaccharide--protein glycosyltransferase subunit 2 [Morus notabilis]
MAVRALGGFLVLLSVIAICEAASVFQPITDAHRSAALELFKPTDGSFGSLEEAYGALRSFEILGIDKKPDISSATCDSVLETLGSSSSSPKDLFHALRVNGILKCNVKEDAFESVVSRLKAAISSASSLLEFYYSIGSLELIKGQSSNVNVLLSDADGIFRSIKALSQSDGRWRYSSNNPESSTYAAGLALKTLAGVVSLASSEIDQSLIGTLKNDITKLFDSVEKYDDGAFYFEEKVVEAYEHHGPLATTSSVVRGFTAFADVTFGNIKVKVSTVLGSNGPPLTVKLVRASSSGSKDSSVIESQELKFDKESASHSLDLPKSVDVGRYAFVFEVVLHDSEHEKVYATGGQTQVPVFITGIIKVDNAEIVVLDSDLGSVESQKNYNSFCAFDIVEILRLDLAGENVVSLSANHRQKLRLYFQLTTPLGQVFKAHQLIETLVWLQAFLKLRHESKVEHIFVVGNSGKKFEILLDFLGLVEKFYYLSGSYDIQLTVGDAVMENSFLKAIGQIELDLPEAPEKAPRPPLQPVDPYSRYGPKAEISHIFRAPDKRPPKELSLAFLGLTFVPLLGFFIGLLRLGVNFKNFPSSAVPTTFAILFHVGIAAVLLLYVLFWLKLDLFTTLKVLGFLGAFLLFVGHRILSHLASTSNKLKSA